MTGARKRRTRAVSPINKLGTTSGLHSSAVGKSILAVLPPFEQTDLIRRLPMTALTEHTITSQRTLRAQLKAIAHQGYALNEQEESAGVHGIAAPVLNHLGTVVGAVCTTIPSYRYEPSKLESNADAVMDAAAAASRRMGYRPPEI